MAIAEGDHEKNRLSELSSHLTVTSSVYRIISNGEIEKVKKTIICVVDKGPSLEEMKFKYYHEE